MSRPIEIPTNTTIIPIHTSTVKTFILPTASINQGKILIFKDIYGTASTNNIYLSTTSTDFVERGSTNRTILSTSYGAWMFTNDGTNTWFIFNAYSNSLSTLSRTIITPLGFSATLVMVGSSISSSWTQSVNATTYTVSYYFTNTNANTGGTLIQTISGITTLFNSITTIPNISYYYYITVTAINTAGQLTITSPTTQPLLLPVAPIGVILMISTPYLYCYWSAQPYTLYYNISFYQTTSQVTSGGTNIQNASNITTTYFLGSFQIINEYYYYAIVTALNMSGSSTNVASSIIFGTIIPGNAVSATMGIAVNDVNVQGYWLQTTNTDYYTMKIFRVATAVTSGGTLYETVTNITGPTAIGTIPLLNSFYYYITVTSINAYGSSSEITGPFTTILILNRPSSVGSVTMTYVGVNAVATWTSVLNTITYTIIFYEVATPTPSGGTIFETFTGNVGLTQTSSRVLVNGNYYYAIVRGVNTYGTATGITSSNTTTQIVNPPQPPTSVTVAYSGGVLSSTWVAGLNATSYSITFYYTTSNTPINGTLVETNTTSGLSNSMSATAIGDYYYYATVTSVNTYGSSSTITSGNVAIITIAPSPATNVAISTSGYYAVCTWTTGTNTATYTVTFYYNSSATTTGGTSFETVTLLAKTTTTSTSTIVMPNGYYIYAVVTAVNPYTTTDVVSSSTTAQIQFPPTNPTNVSISSSIPSVLISWTASTYYATSYTVILYNNGSTNSTTGGTTLQTITGITGTSISISSNLINNNYYYATVTATNAIPLSSSAITSSSATQAILLIQNVSLAVSNTTGVATLSWNSGSTSYTYVLYSSSNNTYTTAEIVGYGTTTSTSATLTTYLATYYYCTVSGITGGTSSQASPSTILQSTYAYPTALALWLDASDANFITGTTSVTAWRDKSGNNYNSTGVVGHYPVLTAAAQNGLSVLTFSGNQELIGSFTLNGNAYTQFAVYSTTSTTVGAAFVDSSPTKTLLIQNGGGNQFQMYFTYGGTFQTSGYRIASINVINPSSSATIWFNGTNQSFGLLGGITSGVATTYYIGARSDLIYYTGTIAEIIVYSMSLSSTQQAQIEGYLAWKWGLQGNLPVGHLYKNASPNITPFSLNIPTVYAGILNLIISTASNVATMSWNPFSDATGYTWVLFQSSSTNYQGFVVSTGTTSSTIYTATYTGLTANAYYFFGVYATIANGISGWGTSQISLYNSSVPSGGSVTLSSFSSSFGGNVIINSKAFNATSYKLYISPTTSIANAVYTSTDTPTGITVFTYTGAAQSYVVPAATTSVNVYMWGAGGTGGTAGGAGAMIMGRLTTTPNETLTIQIGMGGTPNTGYLPTKTGAGGGLTAIQRSGTNVVVVGAGGGGGNIVAGNGGSWPPAPSYGGRGTHFFQGYAGGESYAVQTLGRGRNDITALGGDYKNGGGANISADGDGGVDYGLGGGGGAGYKGGGSGGLFGSPYASYAGGGSFSYVNNLALLPSQTYYGFTSADYTAVGTFIPGYLTRHGAGYNGLNFAGNNGLIIIATGTTSGILFSDNQIVNFSVGTTLSPNTTYYAILVPSNSFGSGTPIVSAGLITPAFPSGGSIVFNTATTTGGTVTITAGTNVIAYSIFISTTTSTNNSVYSFVTTTTGTAYAFTTINALITGTTYYAIMYPTNSYGYGPFSTSSRTV